MARPLSPTLFSHFGHEYDACVLIHDLDEFAKRVYDGTKSRFPQIELDHQRGHVTYVDPLGAIEPIPNNIGERREVAIPFLKHFKHAYQEEYRFVWLPREARRGFGNVRISIGCIDDIAELVRL